MRTSGIFEHLEVVWSENYIINNFSIRKIWRYVGHSDDKRSFRRDIFRFFDEKTKYLKKKQILTFNFFHKKNMFFQKKDLFRKI